MKFENWEINKIAAILPEEFYKLIESNKAHIEQTFPVTLSSCSDLKKTTEFIANNIKKEINKEGYYFYIRNLETKNLIGYFCIKNINRSILKCELAYFIDAAFEGNGIISKVVSETIAYCFNELLMNKVYICTSKVNFASQKIALKNGFQQEGILQEEFKNGEGILEDIVYFGLLKSNYN